MDKWPTRKRRLRDAYLTMIGPSQPSSSSLESSWTNMHLSFTMKSISQYAYICWIAQNAWISCLNHNASLENQLRHMKPYVGSFNSTNIKILLERIENRLTWLAISNHQDHHVILDSRCWDAEVIKKWNWRFSFSLHDCFNPPTLKVRIICLFWPTHPILL